MNHVLTQAQVVVGLLTITFLGPFSALGALVWRRRRARRLRRSPIGIDLLRPPAYTLRCQLDELQNDLNWDMATLMLVPLLCAGVILAHGHFMPSRPWLGLIAIAAAGMLIFVGVYVRLLVKKGHRLDTLRAGYDAELAVGQELDQLMRKGAAVFHDFPGEGFNIDHVVISRRGVIAVETKGYSKAGAERGKAAATVRFDGSTLKFPRWMTKEPLEQAERQAKWLSRWLSSATGDSIKVLPVVALPGWFVDRQGMGAVRVYSGGELPNLLEAVGATGLSAETMQRAEHQVAQVCRDVSRLYKDS